MTNAARLYEESIVIDGCFCKFHQPVPDVPDLFLDHLVASGVTAVNNNLIADSHPMSAQSALMAAYDISAMVDVFPEKLLQVRTVADLKEAKETGRLGIILGTQGLAAIGTDMRYIWVLKELGVRIMQLTYNEKNALGSGCREPHDGGLTRFGQQAIEWINRLGIVLDLSHVGETTSIEAIEFCEAPPIFSHASVRKLCNNPRNLTDEQIKAVAKKDGVIGVCPHSVFVEKARKERPTLDDYVDHIKYIVDLVGIQHVGVGTDNFQYKTDFAELGRVKFERTCRNFFGGYGLEEKHVAGFSKWSDWPNLAEGLLERGFSENDTRLILGENFLRVFRAVWG